MAYAQWIEITLVGIPHKTLHVRNAHLSWGKFYQAPDKNIELGADAINRLMVGPGAIRTPIIAACGRDSSASGTPGGFELYDNIGHQVGRCEWDCPWGLKPNAFAWHPSGGWSAHVISDRLIPYGDSEHFSTATPDVLKQVDDMILHSKVPGAIKVVFQVSTLFFTRTPGPLGAVKIRMEHTAPEHVELGRPDEQPRA